MNRLAQATLSPDKPTPTFDEFVGRKDTSALADDAEQTATSRWRTARVKIMAVNRMATVSLRPG